MMHYSLSKAISKRGGAAVEIKREFVVFFNLNYKNIYLEETFGLMT